MDKSSDVHIYVDHRLIKRFFFLQEQLTESYVNFIIAEAAVRQAESK